MEDIIVSIIILLLSTLISCGVGLYQYLYNPYFGNIRYWVNSNRINATFTDPNSLGAYTLLLFPVFISLMLFFRKWQSKLATCIFFVPFVMNMFFSGSRSAFVGLCVAIFAFLVIGVWVGIRNVKKKFRTYSIRRKLSIVISLFTLAIFFIFLLFNFLFQLTSGPPVSDSIRIVVDSPSSSEVLSGRVKVNGWALDRSVTSGTGIERVEIYIKGKDVWRKEKLLGEAEYGIVRPDVAKYFEKESYLNCGYSFSFDTSSLSDGTYNLYVYAYSFDGSYSYITHKINVGTMPSKSFNLVSNPLVDRIYSTFQNIFKALKKEDGGVFKEISSGRSTLWSQGINMFKDYPISGVGLGAYIIELPNYYVKNGIDSNLIDYVGNYYLQILSELGIAGLTVVLFIFYLIIKKVFIYFRSRGFISGISTISRPYDSNWLIIGFFISFISMLVAQFFGAHTNFMEIQFTFWLIIGLMLTTIKINEENYSNRSNQSHEHGKGHYLSAVDRCREKDRDLVFNDKKACKSLTLTDKVRFTLSEKISLVVIILIFTVSFFISSFTTLSINVKQNLYGWENKYGFYEWEKGNGTEYRWTNIDASESIEKEGQAMVLPVRAGNPDIYESPLWVRVYVDNFLVRVFRVRDNLWHDVRIKLPYIDRKKVTLTISVSRSWVPEKWGLSSDSRELGISVGRVYFIPVE
ncbi:MAG: O-antigen ligase family protein [Actinobacteria bacterium]|nr:O-antigen ligase family protein [Actinomycetota bacterium]